MEKTIGIRIRECRMKMGITQDEDISAEIMQMAMVLQQIESRELRKVAVEQVKVLVCVNL